MAAAVPHGGPACPSPRDRGELGQADAAGPRDRRKDTDADEDTEKEQEQNETGQELATL